MKTAEFVTITVSFEIPSDIWDTYKKEDKESLLCEFEEIGNRKGFEVYDSDIVEEDCL